ncbi:hypothetical protein F7Q91_03600 [Vibrio chagasii]|uniref:Uncharacterized protein n=1 Tax=Vibrio chagasii TaxID=170679 RepID=A0A7V7NX29_9VIBR|nr:hypothetical protein [Vibrio chagasii]KAB0482507.1 hypothetical protein F7Q91_03600 [Vibrio chagasii]
MKTIIQNLQKVPFASVTGAAQRIVDMRLIVIDERPYGTFANCMIVDSDNGRTELVELVADQPLAKLKDFIESVKLRGWESLHYPNLEDAADLFDISNDSLVADFKITQVPFEEYAA